MTRLLTRMLPDLDVNARTILVYDLSESPSAIENFQLILLIPNPTYVRIFFSKFVIKSHRLITHQQSNHLEETDLFSEL